MDTQVHALEGIMTTNNTLPWRTAGSLRNNTVKIVDRRAAYDSNCERACGECAECNRAWNKAEVFKQDRADLHIRMWRERGGLIPNAIVGFVPFGQKSCGCIRHLEDCMCRMVIEGDITF